MAITVTHGKTNNIADWTQADLDAQIALGNFPPGTTLADIVLPSDWNDGHAVTGTPNYVVINNGSGALSEEAQLSSQRGGFGLDMSDVQVVTTSGNLGTITPTSGIIKFTAATVVNAFTAPATDTYAVLYLINDTGSNITLVHEQFSQAAANRIHLKGSVQYIWGANEMLTLVYDFNDSRWKCTASQPVGTANYATYWDSQGRLASEAQLAISRGGTNKSSYTGGSVIYYNSTTGQIDEDNSNFFYDDQIKTLGVGVGTSPDAGIHASAALGPGDPSNGLATINFSGTGYDADDGPSFVRVFYGKNGGIYSVNSTSAPTVEHGLNATNGSGGIDLAGSSRNSGSGAISYKVYPLFDSDAARGPALAAISSAFDFSGGDNGTSVQNVGAGNYSAGDTVDYQVWVLFEGDMSYWDAGAFSVGSFSDGDTFDVQIEAVYSGSGTPSSYIIERQVNGGGFNDYISTATLSVFDDNGATLTWTGGPPTFPAALSYDPTASWTAPTETPSNYRVFRDDDTSGYDEYQDFASTSFADDNTGWTAGDEANDLPPPKQFSIDVSWTNAAGVPGVRMLNNLGQYRDYTGSSGTDDNTNFSSPVVVDPKDGYAFHGQGGGSLFEPDTQTVQIDKSNAGTNVATNSISQAHLALTNSNGSPITGITFKHGSNVRGVFQVDAGNSMNFQSDQNLRFHTNLTTSANPIVNIGSVGMMVSTAGVLSPNARLNTRTNGSADHLRMEASDGTVYGKIEAGFNMSLGASSASTNNSSTDRLLYLRNTNGTNTGLHLSSNTTAQSQGGFVEFSGGRSGADARIGQMTVRYLNVSTADSTGQILVQVNNDSSLLVDAMKIHGHSSLGGITRFGTNTSNATAIVHISAGSNAGAAFCMDAQAAPSSPVAGDMWHDTTQKAFQAQIAGVTQTLQGVIFTQTNSVTVANTVTETALSGTGVGTLTLPANFFVAGKTLNFNMMGFHSSTANPNINIRVKLGSTTVLTTGAVTSGNGSSNGFEAYGEITCRTTGSSGTVIGQGVYNEMHSSGAREDMVNTTTTTINTTTSQTLSITVEWGTASASNTITSTNFSVEVLN
jgi:hypothetical protein